jgi:hypothetical protein
MEDDKVKTVPVKKEDSMIHATVVPKNISDSRLCRPGTIKDSWEIPPDVTLSDLFLDLPGDYQRSLEILRGLEDVKDNKP